MLIQVCLTMKPNLFLLHELAPGHDTETLQPQVKNKLSFSLYSVLT